MWMEDRHSKASSPKLWLKLGQSEEQHPGLSREQLPGFSCTCREQFVAASQRQARPTCSDSLSLPWQPDSASSLCKCFTTTDTGRSQEDSQHLASRPASLARRLLRPPRAAPHAPRQSTSSSTFLRAQPRAAALSPSQAPRRAAASLATVLTEVPRHPCSPHAWHTAGTAQLPTLQSEQSRTGEMQLLRCSTTR